MPILKGLQDTVVIIPYQEGTSQTYEVIDHLVDIPLLIPPAYMVRTQGKPLKDKPWLVARVGNSENAQMRRLFFWKLFKAESRKEDMVSEMLKLWPQEVRIPEAREWPVWDLAERPYGNIRATIVGMSEKFCSQELGTEEDDDGLLDQALPKSVEEAARKDTYPDRAAMARAMGGNPDRKVLEIAWKHRQVFDPVDPGSVKGYFHKIELDTTRELKARIYPLKAEHKDEARREIAKLLEKGMIKPVDSSPFEAPIVMVKKKDASGEKAKWRMCIDYRMLNEHTIRDAYPMPSTERLLDVGKAKFFTKMDLASAFLAGAVV
jgi:hypothetical protein